MSIDTQDGPIVSHVGSRNAETTVITPVSSGNVMKYQINNENTGETLTIQSNLVSLDLDTLSNANLVSVSNTELKIILPSRTKFRVRDSSNFGGTWTAYTTFITRDKRYQSPDAITQLTDDTDSTAATTGSSGGSRTITVTNNATSTVVNSNNGAVVTNLDKVYNDGQLQLTGGGVRIAVDYTDAGATIVNVPEGKNNSITFTNAGATVDNTT